MLKAKKTLKKYLFHPLIRYIQCTAANSIRTKISMIKMNHTISFDTRIQDKKLNIKIVALKNRAKFGSGHGQQDRRLSPEEG